MLGGFVPESYRASSYAIRSRPVEPPEIRYAGTVMAQSGVAAIVGSATASATALPPSIRQGVQVATVADYSSFGG